MCVRFVPWKWYIAYTSRARARRVAEVSKFKKCNATDPKTRFASRSHRSEGQRMNPETAILTVWSKLSFLAAEMLNAHSSNGSALTAEQTVSCTCSKPAPLLQRCMTASVSCSKRGTLSTNGSSCRSGCVPTTNILDTVCPQYFSMMYLYAFSWSL